MATLKDKTGDLYQRTALRVANKLRSTVARIENRSTDLDNTRSSAFPRQIRQLNFASHSDLALRERVAEMKALSPIAGPTGETDLLAETFAIVSVAVQRRLGAWKLFEADSVPQRFGSYIDLASEILSSQTANDDSEHSDAADELSYSENALVEGIISVRKRGRTECASDILLEADFYKALSEIDDEGDLEFRPTGEQLIAGRLLYQGNIVEMDSGEGKTVAAAFPAALHAIRGSAVHIITSNDYLAVRDAEFLAPVYESLGLSVGFVAGYMSDDERRYAYQQNVVYGTLREFAFDYLRDNLRMPNDIGVQGPLNVVIVDEADHALIDQASTPLIISGQPVGNRRGLKKAMAAIEALVACQRTLAREMESVVDSGSTELKAIIPSVVRLLMANPDSESLSASFAAQPSLYRRALALFDDETEEADSRLTADLYYIVDPRSESVVLTELGHEFLENRLGPVFDTSRLERELASIQTSEGLSSHERKKLSGRIKRRIAAQYGQMNQLQQLLRAFVMVMRDVDYLVDDGQVVLIDELTGRTLPDNIYNRGLHAAVQAKERVAIDPERETLAQISVQGFINNYTNVSGMTGTALDAKDEFIRQYGLSVQRVQSNLRPVRIDYGTRVYSSSDDKLAAIADEVRQCHLVGRPVLVGTLTIEQTQRISELLNAAEISHQILSAGGGSTEAGIIQSAGMLGAVTLATNVAGRGTDIPLQPGLNDNILEGYIALIRRLFGEGAGRIRLECSSVDERSLICAALLGVGYANLTEVSHEGRPSLNVYEDDASANAPAKVIEFGLGLHVIGTELNQSSRIDLQLRGRSGRQGAPGTTRFIASMEDQLLAYRRGEATYIRDEPRLDEAGRTFFEGSNVQGHVAKMQRSLSDDDAVERNMLAEYMRLQEAQTAAYYRDRQRIFSLDSFHDIRESCVRGVSQRLVEEFLPDLGISDYRGQFQNLSEELQVEFAIDVSELDGLSALDMPDEISDLILDALDEKFRYIGSVEHHAFERQLYLQTSDEHWRDHISMTQELMMSVSLAGQDRKHAAAEFALRSFQAYETLKEDTIDDFIRKLFQFPAEELKSPTETTRALDEDLAGILA